MQQGVRCVIFIFLTVVHFVRWVFTSKFHFLGWLCCCGRSFVQQCEPLNEAAHFWYLANGLMKNHIDGNTLIFSLNWINGASGFWHLASTIVHFPQIHAENLSEIEKNVSNDCFWILSIFIRTNRYLHIFHQKF